MQALKSISLSRSQRILIPRYILAAMLGLTICSEILFSSAGNIPVLIGSIACCLFCLFLGATKIDLVALIGLSIIGAVNMVSASMYFQDPFAGFSLLLIFPAMYMAYSYLGAKAQVFLKKICMIFGALVAISALMIFCVKSLAHDSYRADGILGNPNLLGIFMVMCYLMLMSLSNKRRGGFSAIEPLILSCLALTLSGGSLLSMIIGLFVVFYRKRKAATTKVMIDFIFFTLSKLSICLFMGILIYVCAIKTDMPQFSFFIVAAILYLTLVWARIEELLERQRVLKMLFSVFLVLQAILVSTIRMSALSTFTERFEMMSNGLSYLFREPLIGIGRHQWYLYNLEDSDTYFNVLYIHNAPLHLGVEIGVIALIATMILFAYRLWKGGKNSSAAAAFIVHNLIDAPMLTKAAPFAMIACCDPRRRGTRLDPLESRIVLFVFIAILLCMFFDLYILTL